MRQGFGVVKQRSLLVPLVVVLLGSALIADRAHALTLTSYFEALLVPNVSTSWTTVPLDNTYTNAIPVCTYVLGTFAGSAGSYVNPPAVTRIRNITANSFQLRIQGWEDAPASTGDVHCVVMDEGAHVLPDGRLAEAHSVLSDFTSGQFSTDGAWNQTLLENVSASIVHNYANPVVLGQVMSHNDNRASVIYVSDCDARQNHPFQGGMADGMCVGKHIGAIASSRNPETIGYIVAEQGSGTINNVFYELARGADTVAGNNNANSAVSYGMADHHTVAVLTQAAEDGGNGSWAVLYGNTPLTPNSMSLAVDEEEIARDASRVHTREPVYYWAFSGAEITLVKQIINDDGGNASLADFALSATGPSSITGVSGTPAVTKAVVRPGQYVLSETNVPGYTASTWACTGASGVTGPNITLNIGDHATCTIINDDKGVELEIEKTASNLTPNIGDVVTFTLVVSNSGPDTATDIDVLDIVPAGLSYVAASITGGDARDESSPAGAGLNWTINSLLSGSDVSLTYQTTVLAP